MNSAEGHECYEGSPLLRRKVCVGTAFINNGRGGTLAQICSMTNIGTCDRPRSRRYVLHTEYPGEVHLTCALVQIGAFPNSIGYRSDL